MKNLMGLNSPVSNRTFHKAELEDGPRRRRPPRAVDRRPQQGRHAGPQHRRRHGVHRHQRSLRTRRDHQAPEGRGRHGPRRGRRLLRLALGPQGGGHRPDQKGFGAGPRPDGPAEGRRQGNGRLTGPGDRMPTREMKAGARPGARGPRRSRGDSSHREPARRRSVRRVGSAQDLYLPADNAAAGWAKDGAPQEFEGEDLYTYIDGGAEIYQEYGFRRVIVQDYEDARVASPCRSRSSRWKPRPPPSGCSPSRGRARRKVLAGTRGPSSKPIT